MIVRKSTLSEWNLQKFHHFYLLTLIWLILVYVAHVCQENVFHDVDGVVSLCHLGKLNCNFKSFISLQTLFYFTSVACEKNMLKSFTKIVHFSVSLLILSGKDL